MAVSRPETKGHIMVMPLNHRRIAAASPTSDLGCFVRVGHVATLTLSGQADFRSMAEAIAVAMVMPAEGPSLGVAPSGTWIWMSTFE